MRKIETKDYRQMDDKRTEAFLIDGKKGLCPIRFLRHSVRKASAKRVSRFGFTFVELVIIIAIVGILAGAAIFKGWGLTNPNVLKVAVDQVIADIRFAQSMAMAESRWVCLTFTNGSRSYILGSESRQLPEGVVSAVSQGFSFNLLGEYPETNDKYLTLRAGASTKRVRVYTVTAYAEEN